MNEVNNNQGSGNEGADFNASIIDQVPDWSSPEASDASAKDQPPLIIDSVPGMSAPEKTDIPKPGDRIIVSRPGDPGYDDRLAKWEANRQLSQAYADHLLAGDRSETNSDEPVQ